MNAIYQGFSTAPPVLLTRHERTLGEVVAEAPDPVTAVWTPAADAQPPGSYALTLRSDYGEATSWFAADELDRPTHMRVRFHQLWGKVLKAYTDRLVAGLRED